jgi:hypothetical protein
MNAKAPFRTALPASFAAFCLLVLVTAGPAAAAPAPDQTCPRHLADEPCSVDLLTGNVTGPCVTPAGPPFYPAPPAVGDSDGDGWLETVVPVTLTDECRRVCVVLDYVEDPTGFTLDFGDSVTNNGHGGNAGTGESEAELQILGDVLTLFSRSYGSGLVDRVAQAKLQLDTGSYKVCVSDQQATFGQPLSAASTPNGRALYALPDPFDGNSDVFIGLNRVISALGGAPSLGRVGTGLRRAYVTLE